MRLVLFVPLAAALAAHAPAPAADKETDEEVARLVKIVQKDFDPARRGDAIKKLAGMGPAARAAARPLFEVALNPKYRANQKAALEAIESISPKAYQAGRTLILDDGWFERADALKDVEKLPPEDRAALFPVVLKAYRFERVRSKGNSFVLSDILRTMAAAYPDEDETKDAWIETITYQGRQFPASGSRATALDLLPKLDLDKKALYKALVTALGDPNLENGARAVRAMGDLGADAKPSLAALKKLKFHKEKIVREAADEAVAKIEAAK